MQKFTLILNKMVANGHPFYIGAALGLFSMSILTYLLFWSYQVFIGAEGFHWTKLLVASVICMMSTSTSKEMIRLGRESMRSVKTATTEEENI